MKNKTTPENIRIEGWLVPTTETVYLDMQVYDDDYNPTDEYYEDEDEASVVGLELESGKILILAKYLQKETDSVYRHCKTKNINATIRYHISEEKKTFEELNENVLRVLYGDPDADYGHHCSDLTGYLWTDEKFIVNGHDIMNELKGYMNHYGKHTKTWFSMEILFHNLEVASGSKSKAKRKAKSKS